MKHEIRCHLITYVRMHIGITMKVFRHMVLQNGWHSYRIGICNQISSTLYALRHYFSLSLIHNFFFAYQKKKNQITGSLFVMLL